MRARSARRLSVLPARTQLSSVDRSSGVKVRRVGYLLIPHHGIYRLSLQLSTSSDHLDCRLSNTRTRLPQSGFVQVLSWEAWNSLALPAGGARSGRLIVPSGTSRREVGEARELKRTAATRRLEPLTSTVVRDVG